MGDPLRPDAPLYSRPESVLLFEPTRNGGLEIPPSAVLLGAGIKALGHLCKPALKSSGQEGAFCETSELRRRNPRLPPGVAADKEVQRVVGALREMGVEPVKAERARTRDEFWKTGSVVSGEKTEAWVGSDPTFYGGQRRPGGEEDGGGGGNSDDGGPEDGDGGGRGSSGEGSGGSTGSGNDNLTSAISGRGTGQVADVTESVAAPQRRENAVMEERAGKPTPTEDKTPTKTIESLPGGSSQPNPPIALSEGRAEKGEGGVPENKDAPLPAKLTRH